MATTVISVPSFQNTCAECADAIASENWAAATKWYAQAEAINAGLELEASSADDRMRRRDSLSGLQVAIGTAKSAVAGSDNRRFITSQTRHTR